MVVPSTRLSPRTILLITSVIHLTLLPACARPTAQSRPPPEAVQGKMTSSGQPATSQDGAEPTGKKGGLTLPDGPCQKAVDCERTRVSMNPFFLYKGEKICFWDPDARCACAKELDVDDSAFCERGHY